MSFSIVKKALELFDDEGDKDKDSLKGKKKSSKPSTEKQDKFKKKRKEHRKLEKNLKKAKQLTAFDERDKYMAPDRRAANVQLLRELSTLGAASEKTVDKVVQHHTGRLSKNRAVKQNEGKSANQQSVFTDKDFDKFEKEYAF